MALFDFHVHPALKASFTVEPNPDFLLQPVTLSEINGTVKCAAGEGAKVFTSQCNYTTLLQNEYLHKGGVVLGHAIYSPEKGILEGLLRNLKNPLKRNERIKNPFGVQFEYAMVDRALRGDITPFEWALQSLSLLEKYKAKGWLQTLTSASQLDNPDEGSIVEFYGIEGCHAIADHINPDKITAAGIMKNLKLLIDRKLPIVNFMITHLEQSPVANHAYGMQFLDNSRPGSFKPQGETFSNMARQLVVFAQQNNISIDVKHLGYASRAMFYQVWQPLAQRRPIVCSHAGIAGISAADYHQYVVKYRKIRNDLIGLHMAKPWKYTRYASFNISTINLFDEDIIAIVESEGLIGISLDARIVGFGHPKNNHPHIHPEFPTELEYLAAADLVNANVAPLFKNGIIREAPDDELQGMRLATTAGVYEQIATRSGEWDYHMNCLVVQLIHVMQVAIKHCGKTQQQALGYACIGSDMDGLISPIYPLESYKDFAQSFEDEFCKAFKLAWEDGIREGDIQQPLALSTQEVFRRFTHTNGVAFLKQWIARG